MCQLLLVVSEAWAVFHEEIDIISSETRDFRAAKQAQLDQSTGLVHRLRNRIFNSDRRLDLSWASQPPRGFDPRWKGDLSKEILAKTSDEAAGWKSTFGPRPLALSPVHIGAGSVCGGVRSLSLLAVYELGTGDVCAILPRLTTLTALDLSHNPLLDNSVAESIASNCTSLTSLRISGCSRISDAGIIPLVRCCPFIRALDISGLKDVSDVPLHELALRTRRVWSDGWDRGLLMCEEKAVQNYRSFLPHAVSKLALAGAAIEASIGGLEAKSPVEDSTAVEAAAGSSAVQPAPIRHTVAFAVDADADDEETHKTKTYENL